MPLDNSSSSRSGQNAWALLDQILISGSNFVTMVLVVRSLTWSRAGDFTHIHSLLLLLNTLQIALVIQPLNVLAATLRGTDYRKFTTSMAVGQIILAIALAGLALVAAAVTYALGLHAAPLLLALAPAIVAWQLQEFVRRVLYTEDRLRTAFVNDLICYGGQMASMCAAFLLGRRHGTVILTGPVALYIIAITSAVAAAAGAMRIRKSLAGRLDFGEWRRSWRFGRWLAGSETLNFVSSVHLNQYIVSLATGSVALGGALRIVQQLFGPMRVMAYFLGNILPIRFARTLAADGPVAMHTQLKKIAVVVIPILLGYCTLVWIFAGPLLRIYDPEYVKQANALRLYGVSAGIGYGGMVLLAALMARQKTHLIFVTHVIAALSTLIFGWPLAHRLKVNGGAINMIISSTIVVSILGWTYVRQHRRAIEPAEQASVSASDGIGQVPSEV